MALVSILRIVSTHSWLPFKDDASDRYEKRAVVRGHPEVSGDISSSSVQGHLQKLGQVAPGRRKMIFLADSHDAGRAGSTTWDAQIKVEHYLHRNVYKMGYIERILLRKYPTCIPQGLIIMKRAIFDDLLASLVYKGLLIC